MTEPDSTPQNPPSEEASQSNVQFWLVFAGMIVAVLLWNQRGTPGKSSAPMLQPGVIIDAPITLVTADRNDLSCAMDSAVSGYACAFSAPDKPNAALPAADHVLAPYMTTQGQLFLVAGLFEQAPVDERYRKEPPEGKKRETLRRFTAQCKIKLVGEVEARLRWAQNGPWGEPARAWTAVPAGCKVGPP